MGRQPHSSLVAVLGATLALGCFAPADDPGDLISGVDPDAFTAVLAAGDAARPLALNHHALKLEWGVTHTQELGCAGADVAGGEVVGTAQLSHLGASAVSVSAAWDIGHQIQGTPRYTPVGPAGGPVAPVLGQDHYPYTFAFDPVTGTCQPSVRATGKVAIAAANGDRVLGDIVGGETHRLDFILPGDGVETFAEVQVTGGTGRFAGADGSFVVHTIARFQATTLSFGIQLAELLPGATLGY
jgi:hypothetical protein